jgi:hypothetical protein
MAMTKIRSRLASLAAVALLSFAAALPAQAAIMSDYLENKIVDWLARGQSFTPPATWYAALNTAACSDSSGGTEVTGGSYARVSITLSTTNFSATDGSGSTANPSAGTSGTTYNLGSITFPAPTANWGVASHVKIMDASTSGNMLFCIALTTPKTINNGDAAPTFPAGSLSIQLDN